MISGISNTTQTTTGTGSSNSATDPAAAQDRFLKLLVAQLNNQDPLSPMENAEMTSQIAQINTVTGIQQLNQTMESMAAQFNSMQIIQGAALIGRDVMIDGNSLAVRDGIGKGGFEIAGTATGIKLEVLTPGGQVVDTVELGSKTAGRHNFEWDASKYEGDVGALQFRITPTSGSTELAHAPLALSKVTAAGVSNGQLALTLENGKTVNYSEVQALV